VNERERDGETNFQISTVSRTTPFTLITPLNRAITSVVKLQDMGGGRGQGELQPPPPPPPQPPPPFFLHVGKRA